ncbi:MAG: 50S ribosomal protein L21e [Candidatus Diapherotrites archaeon]|nr:50S ribosomal protein L21e [Candidatus Diapherotrites archaeon]
MKQSGNPRTQGKRSKTRYKFKKHGAKVSVNDIMREFEIGDKVQIVVDGSYHYGLPDKNFHGLSGIVAKKRGDAYEVSVAKGNQPLTVVTTAVHIKKIVN